MHKLNIPKWIYSFLIGFFIGIFILILSGDFILGSDSPVIKGGLYNEIILSQIQNISINKAGLFFYIVKKRFILAIFLLIAGKMRSKKQILKGFLIYIGICVGVSLSAYIVRMGMSGIFFFILSLIPHCVFYIVGYAVLFLYSTNEQKSEIKNIGIILGSFVVIMIGVFLESYVNSDIIIRFLKFI